MGDGEEGYDVPKETEEIIVWRDEQPDDDGYCPECGKHIALNWNEWDGKCLLCEKRLQFAEELGDEQEFNDGKV